MTSKYINLPDIDTESPQVFESSEIENEEVLSHSSSNLENGSSIDSNDISTKQAKEKFSNVIIDEDDIDFSGDASHSNANHGFTVRKVSETFEQKLARISRELEELKFETSASTPQEKDRYDSLTTLLSTITRSSTNDKLEGQKFNQHLARMNNVFDELTNNIENMSLGLKKTVEKPRLVETLAVLKLEKRIYAIENRIGAKYLGDCSFSHKDTTIRSHIAELNRMANLVYNPEYNLDLLAGKVAEINSQYEGLLSKERLLGVVQTDISYGQTTQIDNDESAKIHELHQYMKEFEQINHTIPLILKRLKSLHSVHMDIANSVNTVDHIDNILNNMKMDMVKWDQSLDNVQSNVEKSSQSFERSKGDISKSLKSLSEKVDILFSQCRARET